MSQQSNEKRSEPRPDRRSLSKLFKVLVIGGAVMAGAYVSAIHGGTGTATHGEEDGGPQGW